MKLYIMAIEPLDTRYTAQWLEHIPEQLKADNDIDIVTICGEQTDTATTEGAFLNFFDTNIYKSTQLVSLLKQLDTKETSLVLFTDAWNPCALQLRYIIGLQNLKIHMFGMWHAGSYDKNDFLGRTFVQEDFFNTPWTYDFEIALHKAYDYNYFATYYHRQIFYDTLGLNLAPANTDKSLVVGWPCEYMLNMFDNTGDKTDLVVFPHRMAPEKQPEVFNQLIPLLEKRGITAIFTQEHSKNKEDYHNLLRRAKVVFSCSLQETLGIGIYEGMLNGCLPLVPDDLAYTEIMTHLGVDKEVFMYTHPLTNVVDKCCYLVENYLSLQESFHQNLLNTNYLARYYSGERLYTHMLQDR